MTPFYSQGLRFSCTKCSACCRHGPGFVFLSHNDVNKLAKHTGMEYISFVKTYCRWVDSAAEAEVLSLKDKSNYDCIFWKGEGCSVYEARPLQCRTFPFWQSILADPIYWDATAQDCPGMNTGSLHTQEEIEAYLAARIQEPILTRADFCEEH